MKRFAPGPAGQDQRESGHIEPPLLPAAKILVVDDNAPALKATVRILQQSGYTVEPAADGAEALRLCRAYRPDLVLLDVMLPDLPGLEVLRQIRLDPDLAGAAVVMLSALQIKPEQQAVGLDTGADGYLTRPITNTELLARVRAILRQREQTDAVRKSEALHRSLFEASPHPMWMYDPDTLRFVAVNDATVAHYGYSRAEFLGMTILDIRPAEEAPVLRKAVESRPQGVHKSGAWRHRLKDGRIVMMEITAYSLDYAGRPARMVIANDITERIEGEVSRRKQTEQLVKAQRIAHVGSWELNLAAHTVTCSEEVYRIFGLKPDTAPMGRESFSACIHPDDRDIVAAAKSRTLAGDGPLEVEHRIVRPDGKIRHVVERAELLLDGQGVAVAVSGTVQDITERKQAEVALSESEERFRSLLQGVPSVAIQGYALDGTVQYWNEASERFYGYSREEALRGNLLDLIIPPEMRPGVRAALHGVEEGRDIPNGELDLMRKDGSRIPVFSSHAVVRRAGHPPELFCIDVDLSDRQRAEAERRQLINNLQKRVSELRALHRAAELLRDDELTTAELLGEVARLLPAAMQYPDIAAARIKFGETEQATLNFKITPWCLGATFTTGSGTPGRLEIVYLEESPPLPEGHFHAEERNLTFSLAEMLRAYFDRADAIKSLRKLQRHQQLILESVGEGIHGLDIHGNIIFENPAGVAMLGWPESELIGRHSHTVIHHHHADGREYPAADCPIYRTLRDGVVRRIDQEVFFRKDGTSFPVEYLCSPVRDETGIITGAVVSFRDITERKRAADQLAEQAKLLDKARDAILVRDLDNRILYWNQSAERLFGWTREEAVGHHVRELCYQDMASFDRATATTLETGEWVGEIEQLTKAGAKITVEGRWTLVRDDAGKPTSILTINTDITERKMLEQQFLRAQRLESIGTLAGGIAHDLNNLLAPITMGLELLRTYVDQPKARTIIDTMERSAQRGADLVKQVLSFARGLEGARVRIQLKHIVLELEKIMESTFPKSIRVSRTLGPDLWTVLGDPTQLNQVVLNLCVNARDAMPDGGNLTIEVTNREFDAQYAAMNHGVQAGRYVVIEVIDTGCGIPRENLERIYDPFFTTKEVGKGTGLGLSTVLGIVRSHGGFVNVYSEVGLGTTFKICLPALTDGGSRDTAVPGDQHLPRGKGELILLVDDEVSILNITQHTLEAFGYRVITAEDGAQAIALYVVQAQEIAVVLTDMMMPVMDGPALIAALKRVNPGVRILASSGLNANGRVTKAVSAGVQHFIPKPYSAEMLLQLLKKMLDEPLAAGGG